MQSFVDEGAYYGAPQEFQFPSNGKVHAKFLTDQMVPRWGPFVSIPFKREGACKETPVPHPRITSKSFNSLQTGRCMQSVANEIKIDATTDKFQFPSNGKVHAKFLSESFSLYNLGVSIPFKREGACKVRDGPRWEDQTCVSIPFKREGACKVAESDAKTSKEISFNSLQTGRCMQSCFPAQRW